MGGAGLAGFAIDGSLLGGGGLKHWEAGRPIKGMDPQKHIIGHLDSVSKFSEGNWFPLEFWLEDGRGKWCLPVPLFPC